MSRKDKSLRRSRSEKVVAGVLGGLGDYFGLDVTLVRLIFVLVSIFSAAFPGLLVYIILWVVVPEEDHSNPTVQSEN